MFLALENSQLGGVGLAGGVVVGVFACQNLPCGPAASSSQRPSGPGLPPAVYQPTNSRRHAAAGAASVDLQELGNEAHFLMVSQLLNPSITCRSGKLRGCATDKSCRTSPSARRPPKA